MQISNKIKTLCLVAALSIAGWTTTQAQTTATWIGPNVGGEWNTAASWDLQVVPGAATNALIGASTNVSYNLPMAASFGILTNSGILAVNTNGFNCSLIFMPLPGSGSIFYLTNGFGSVNVTGNFTMPTNGSAAMVAGTSLTVGGTLGVASASSSHASGTSTFTNSGGTLNANSTSVGAASGTGTGRMVISGGVNNLGNTTVGRYGTASASTLGTEGLIISGGSVTMSNLTASGASYGTAYISGGTVTNIGNVSINGATAGRYMRVVQAGGLFVVPDPGIIYENTTTVGAETARYQVTGGTNIVGGFYLGASNSAVAATVTVTIGGAVYVGSQGIATNGAVLNTFTLNAGGLLGATAPWTASIPMNMSGSGAFTIQKADMNGNPYNITNNGVLNGASTCKLNVTGGGTLTFGATNIYAGATLINGGTLTLAASGALASPLIIVGPGTTFDVSAIAGGFLLTNQTLEGSGTVNGAVIVAPGATIQPGSNALTGTLTFNNSITETNGGAVNSFALNGAPNPNNDLIVVSGDLNASGTNYMNINASLPVPGTNYTLIQYGGNFNGNITNFAVLTAIGTLTNDLVAKTISFIPAVSQRGPTNTVWVGNPVNTNWDATIATDTNWLIASSSVLTSFVTGDSVQFTDANASNSPVNIVGTVSPGSIMVNSHSNYVIASTSGGWIAGTTGLTVTNTGTLTVLTTNTYTGNTIVDGGSTLAVAQLATAGSPSGIGEGNLIINNGTFGYTGPSVSVNIGATLGNASSTINISANGNLTLSGLVSGNGGLTVTGSGRLALASANSYTNVTTIAGGVLQLNNGNGASSGPINFNNGTLAYYPSGGIDVGNPFNFAAGTTNQIIVTSGSGGQNPISEGAWTGSGVILVNTTFNPYTVNGVLDGFTGTILLTTTNGSAFRFNSGGGNSCFGSTNATFDLGTNNAILTCRNAGTMNLGALQGDSGTSLQGQSADSGTVIWSIGNNNLSTIFAGTISNSTSTRIAAITKIGTGRLTLEGQSLYTGTTTVSNGVLALALNPVTSLNGSIDDSATINVTPGAVLDASGRSDQTLQIGNSATQQLRGRGTINGSLSVNGAGTVAPGGGTGGSTGTLTVTNTINLSGTAWMKLNRANSPNSDQLVTSSTSAAVNYGGTLVVTNIGAALQVGDTFTLFGGTTFNSSSFSSLVLPLAYTWDTSQLNVNGSITVTGILTPPTFSKFNFNQLAGTIAIDSYYPGATNQADEYYEANIYTTTNLALPYSSWTLATNAYFDHTGHLLDFNNGDPITFNMNPTNSASFYQVQVFLAPQ